MRRPILLLCTCIYTQKCYKSAVSTIFEVIGQHNMGAPSGEATVKHGGVDRQHVSPLHNNAAITPCLLLLPPPCGSLWSVVLGRLTPVTWWAIITGVVRCRGRVVVRGCDWRQIVVTPADVFIPNKPGGWDCNVNVIFLLKHRNIMYVVMTYV